MVPCLDVFCVVIRMLDTFQGGKQHDVLKGKTRDKTLEDTLKISINTKLQTCDDKGVFTDDDDTYRKHKKPTEVGGW